MDEDMKRRSEFDKIDHTKRTTTNPTFAFFLSVTKNSYNVDTSNKSPYSQCA